MQLPVWVTVVVARFVGGFAVGLLAGVVFVGRPRQRGRRARSVLHSHADIRRDAHKRRRHRGRHRGAAAGALGVPCHAGTAIVASFVGQLIPFIGGLLISHAVTDNGSATMYLPLYGTAAPLLSLALTVAGIAATAWMIQSSTMIGSGRGPRYELYAKARRESLDDEY